MYGLDHRHLTGRNADAPELSTIEECRGTHLKQLVKSTPPEVEDMEDHACVMECITNGQQRQWSSDGVCGNTTAGISRAVTANPGSVPAYVGQTSTPHHWGAVQLHESQL